MKTFLRQNCEVCLIGQCIEGMVVLEYTSGRSFNMFKLQKNLSKRCYRPPSPPPPPRVYKNAKECICILYNFQACCIVAGYRDITPGSELKDHPSYIENLAYSEAKKKCLDPNQNAIFPFFLFIHPFFKFVYNFEL